MKIYGAKSEVLLYQNQDRRKVIQINSYLPHWIHDDQNLSYATINSVNPLYLIIHKKYGIVKYLPLVPTDKSKDMLKSMKNYGTKLEILLYQ